MTTLASLENVCDRQLCRFQCCHCDIHPKAFLVAEYLAGTFPKTELKKEQRYGTANVFILLFTVKSGLENKRKYSNPTFCLNSVGIRQKISSQKTWYTIMHLYNNYGCLTSKKMLYWEIKISNDRTLFHTILTSQKRLQSNCNRSTTKIQYLTTEIIMLIVNNHFDIDQS